jgi:succinyl-diaminopimelate desuccinylase
MDPLPLSRDLIACPSVTPADAGAQAVLSAALTAQGFTVTPLKFGNIENFYAERPGPGAKLCFAGHTDVVPPGEGWRHDPFGAVVENGILYGRGAVDMKSAIAAFAAATTRAPGHICLLITGDEEGEAINGTTRVLDWMREHGKLPDFCIVGEPTSQARLGDTVKIGRRGSLNARITLPGRQGHSAYPQLADNPIHRLIPALHTLLAHKLDDGTERFQPSSLQITTIDVGNPASNVIPGLATARLNIRFNNLHTGASLSDWLTEILARYAPAAELDVKITGEAFLTQPGLHTEALTASIEKITGLTPEQNTGGGTSDARFIAKFCPVAEFGLVGATMHKLDECVPIAELEQLTAIYAALIARFCV